MKYTEWVLRIALCGEFLGHGVFALRAAPGFQALLMNAAGFSQGMAERALPVIGVIDVLIALLALVRPVRGVLLYAAVWGFLTALSRPLAGLEIWDFVERWPNWGVPLALLLVRGLPQKPGDWLR